MAVLPIHEFPDAVLRRKAEPVATLDDTLQHLIDDMIQTMYDAPGIGLAAPQVGISLRLFVVDVTSGRDAHALMTFINPEIIKAEGRIQEDEGCLSLPGVYGPTPRATHVVIRGMNRHGKVVEVEGEGLLARAFQHEMDHLDGLLFLDRVRGIKRDLIVRKIRKLARAGKW